MTSKKHLWKLPVLVASLAMGLGVFTVIKASPKNAEPAFATYTNGDASTYYNSIDSTQSGNTLLTALRSLNLSKRKSTVGYDSMGTTPSGQFKYTDYDPNYVSYDSNGQPYGTRISSFYTYTSATSWNREHVWPNSHGGGSGGDAGTPYPDADIHMPRPTISSENSSRGNSFFVEGMNHSSNGWDPYTAGYSENSRGEAARITFYCTLVNSKLVLAPSNTTPSGTDSITGISYGSKHTMGNLETLIKWNINYPVTQREKNRNEGAEYLQGNRNAFVDHPEYACKIWGTVNSTIQNMCNNASWDVGPSVSISRSSASIVVDDTTQISATASDSSTITWSSSDSAVVTVSTASSASGASITLNGVGPGTATVTARATINSTTYSATCNVTVSTSGSGGGDSGDSSAEGSVTATSGSLTGWNSSGTGSAYNDGSVKLDSSGDNVYKTDIFSGVVSSGMTSLTVTVNGKINGTPTSSNSYRVEALDSSGNVLASDVKTGASVVGTNYGDTTFTISSGLAGCTGFRITYVTKGSGNWGVKSVSWVATYSSGEEEKTLSSISVATAPTKTIYTAGETFNPAGLVITRNYSDSTSDTYAYAGHTSEFTFSPDTSTALTTSNASVTITYGGKSCSQAITVNAAKTLSSITLSGQTTSFVEGDNFSFGGTVTAHYSDSTTANVTSSATFSGYNMSTAGNQTVTASYTEGGTTKTANYSITVGQGTLLSIAVSGQTTTYMKNTAFSFDGTCTATFANGYQKSITPTSVSSPDMSSAGNKTITVSLTYNGNTRITTYDITVNSDRVVIEETTTTGYSVIGTITYPSNTETISVNTLSTSTSGYKAYESNAIRLGSGSNTGSVTVTSTTSNITKVVVSAKSYGSDTGVTLTVGGTSNTITSSYANYTKEYTTAVNSCAIATTTNKKRAYVESITVYETKTTTTQTDISTTEDCVGLETFITAYMHMDYVSNLGYCKDSEHHYYSSAKSAFNALNTHQRSLFTSNTAYSSEWARLSAWATANGESLNNSNQLSNSPAIHALNSVINSQSNLTTIIAILVGVISLGSISVYIYLRHRRREI